MKIFILLCILGMLSENSFAEIKNIAKFAKIRTVPQLKGGYVASQKIVDSNSETGAAFRTGVRMPGIYRFIFNTPVNISKISFIQGRTQRFVKGSLSASTYIIKADTNNDGIYDLLLVKSSKGKNNEWSEHIFPSVKVYRVMFKALKGSPQWETSYPFMREFEIYADQQSYMGLESKSKKRRDKQKSFPDNIQFLERGKEVQTPPFTDAERNAYTKGVIVNFWNFGLYPYMKGTNFNFKDKKIVTSSTFNDFIEKLNYLNANTACLMREAGKQLDTVCWPSEKFNTVSPNRDFLQEFCDAIHANNLKVNLLIHQAGIGAYKKQKKATRKDYTLTHNFIREGWGELIKEAAARDLDGIYISPDELFFSQPSICNLDPKHPVRVEFKKEFGVDPLISQANLFKMEIFRKEVIFGYEQAGKLLKYWNQCAKSVNPNIITLTNLIGSTFCYNNRLIYGLSYDILAQLSGVDYFGIDYQNKHTRRLVGASRKVKSNMIVFSSPDPADYLSCVFMGAKDITVYRYNYIFKEKASDALRCAFGFLNVLAQWGFAKAKTPKKIILAVSRASEDWYTLDKGAYYAYHKGTEKNYRGKEGFWAYQIIREFLEKYNYTYKVIYLDNLSNLDVYNEISKDSLVIMPFAYSITQDLAYSLENAFDNGTKFLILQKKGEVNKYGMKNKGGPLLKNIIEKGKKNGRAIFIEQNLCEYEMKPEFNRELNEKMNLLLKNKNPLHVESYGKKVLAYMMENDSRNKVFLISNKEKSVAKISLRIPMPMGSYSIHIRSSKTPEQEFIGKISSKIKFQQKDLQSFGILLDSQENIMFYIKKIKGE